ncbi:hypothetical protein [Planobispora rosea]|nr:hypothetical protein [Planobispora rosea]
MGVSISVAFLADLERNDPDGAVYHRRAFERLSAALAQEGIAWREPDAPDTRPVSAGMPYGYLHHLRRVFVLHKYGRTVTSAHATDPDQYDLDMGRVNDETTLFSSHLLCHADSEGYYVPVDFGDPLFLPEQANVAGGGIVGSSQRLRAELAFIAPALGIKADGTGAVPQRELARLAATPPDDPFEPELFAWHRLYRACTVSISSGHAVVFH